MTIKCHVILHHQTATNTDPQVAFDYVAFDYMAFDHVVGCRHLAHHHD
jgi:hypothetical protein